MRPTREPVLDKVRRIITLGQGIYAFCYTVLGYFVISQKRFLIFELDEKIAYSFGGLLIIYGIYRIYRSIVFYREVLKKD